MGIYFAFLSTISGSSSCICSDKTGTLTQNVMAVAHLFFNGQVAEADTSEFITGRQFDLQDPGFAALANVAALCSRANFKPGQEELPVLKRLTLYHDRYIFI